MNIAIFGDSFADMSSGYNTNEYRMPWMMWIEKLSEHKVTNFGLSGTSVWFSYKKFLKNFLNYDVIIFCYSNHERWFNINNREGLSFIVSRDQLSVVSPNDVKLIELLVEARPHIYDEQLNKFVFQSVFDSVNKLCKENDRILINLLNFEENFNMKLNIDISKSSGTVLTNISGVAQTEKNLAAGKIINGKNVKNLILTECDFRFCHLNTHNNKVLANIILENLSNPKSYVNLIYDDRWSYDIKHLESYFD